MLTISYRGSLFHYDENTNTLILFSPAEDLYIPSTHDIEDYDIQYDASPETLILLSPEDDETSPCDSKLNTFTRRRRNRRKHPDYDISSINIKNVSLLNLDGTVPVYENVRRIYIADAIDNLIADNRNFPNLEDIIIIRGCPNIYSIGSMFIRDYTLEYVFSAGMKQKCVLPSWGAIHKLGPKAFQHTQCTEIVSGYENMSYCRSTFNGSRFIQQDTPCLMLGNILLRCRGSIELPENTELIDSQAFFECQNDIEITASLATLGKIKAIPHHPNVKYIIRDEVLNPDVLLNMGNTSVFQNIINHPDRYIQKLFAVEHDALLSIDKKTLIYVKPHKNHSLLDYTVSDGIESITPQAFTNNPSIRSINLPSSVTKIYPKTFCDCPFLQNLSFPPKLKEIPAEACKACKALEQIEWPTELESIGTEAFSECGLTSLILPKSVRSVASKAFSSCEDLQSMILPNAQYGNSVFSSCSALKSVNLPDDMTVIPNSMFMMCGSLQKITLPQNLKAIQDGAFYSCGLTEINIPNSVTSIGKNAFVNNPCQNIELPESLNSIGNNAFSAHTLIVQPNKSLKIFASVFANNGTRNLGTPLTLIINHPNAPQQILKMSAKVNTGALYRLDRAWQRGEFDKLEEIYFNGLPKNSDEKFDFASDHLTDDPISIYHIYLKTVAEEIYFKLIDQKKELRLSELIKCNIFTEKVLREMLPLTQNKQMTTTVAYILEKLNELRSHQDLLDL